MPEFAIKPWTKAIRPRASIGVHVKESIINLLVGEGGRKGKKLGYLVRVKVVEGEAPSVTFGRANQIVVEVFENSSFLIIYGR